MFYPRLKVPFACTNAKEVFKRSESDMQKLCDEYDVLSALQSNSEEFKVEVQIYCEKKANTEF